MLPLSVVVAILVAVPMSLVRRHREKETGRASHPPTQSPNPHAPPRLVWSSSWSETDGPSGESNPT
jgi:hypothetical protein